MNVYLTKYKNMWLRYVMDKIFAKYTKQTLNIVLTGSDVYIHVLVHVVFTKPS